MSTQTPEYRLRILSSNSQNVPLLTSFPAQTFLNWCDFLCCDPARNVDYDADHDPAGLTKLPKKKKEEKEEKKEEEEESDNGILPGCGILSGCGVSGDSAATPKK